MNGSGAGTAARHHGWACGSAWNRDPVPVFKRRHFAGEVILWAMRWYCRYGISYRDLEEVCVDRGVTLDFRLADRRNTMAAKRFLKAALKRSPDWLPRTVNTDTNPADGEAIATLRKERMIPEAPEDRQTNVLKNRIVGAHRTLSRLICTTPDLKLMRTDLPITNGFKFIQVFKTRQQRLYAETVSEEH